MPTKYNLWNFSESWFEQTKDKKTFLRQENGHGQIDYNKEILLISSNWPYLKNKYSGNNSNYLCCQKENNFPHMQLRLQDNWEPLGGSSHITSAWTFSLGLLRS